MRAVITGGTRGIGLATAVELGRDGYDIILTGFSQEDADTALKELTAKGIKAEFYFADSAKEEDVNAVFGKAGRKIRFHRRPRQQRGRPGRTPAL